MRTTLFAVVFDCADAATLGRFWSELLERPLDDDATTGFVSIGLSAGDTSSPHWLFIPVPEGKTVKNRVHVDLVAEDLPAAIDRAVELGARRLADYAEGAYTWTTLADPEGNEFDIVAT